VWAGCRGKPKAKPKPYFAGERRGLWQQKKKKKKKQKKPIRHGKKTGALRHPRKVVRPRSLSLGRRGPVNWMPRSAEADDLVEQSLGVPKEKQKSRPLAALGTGLKRNAAAAPVRVLPRRYVGPKSQGQNGAPRDACRSQLLILDFPGLRPTNHRRNSHARGGTAGVRAASSRISPRVF